MKNKDVIIFGLAIFAMFFGAGNLIFPPEIRMVTGKEWMKAALGFFLTGIFLPISGLLAFSQVGDIDAFALKFTTPTKAGIMSLVELPTAAIIGHFFLGEYLFVVNVIGIVILLVGTMVSKVEMPKKKTAVLMG
ncbi:branched-chain amino acid transport system II carrier protein [Psychrilyobacter sp.]|uniref:branched-chain amino acid transport system II carrier protein n=1 Tax=Psychrilyobacter sp. TaxID=2586924 RepID=UPI003018BAF0